MTLMLGYIDLSHLLMSPDAGRMTILAAGLALGIYSQRKRLGSFLERLMGYASIVAPSPSGNTSPPWDERMSAYRVVRTCLVARGNLETATLLDKDVLPCLVKEDFEFAEEPQGEEA